MSKDPERFELTFKGKPNAADLEPFSEAEIQSLLSNLPKTIYAYGIDKKEKFTKWEEAKSQVKLQRALKMLEAGVLKARKDLASEGDRKAWVDSRDEVINAETAEITAHGAYIAAELLEKHAENLFVAVRKAASMIEQDNKSMARESKYGGADRG